MVARLKLKGIDGRAPPGVNYLAPKSRLLCRLVHPAPKCKELGGKTTWNEGSRRRFCLPGPISWRALAMEPS